MTLQIQFMQKLQEVPVSPLQTYTTIFELP